MSKLLVLAVLVKIFKSLLNQDPLDSSKKVPFHSTVVKIFVKILLKIFVKILLKIFVSLLNGGPELMIVPR